MSTILKSRNKSSTTAWIKFQVNGVRNYCFVGNNEAVAFNLNSYILFKNLNTGQESFYTANGSENGNGVAEIAGHKVYPIFAFSETSSRIFIVSYPDFNQISIFEPKKESLYIGLAFSETEHLIALTGMPNYKIQVYYWRTHELLISKETEMITDKQKITCSHSLPLTVAQFAYTRGELNVWEVHGTLKYCKLIKRKIELNLLKFDGPFQDVYSIEGSILIVNKHGEIFNVVPSSGAVNQIVRNNSEKGEFETSIAYIRNGVLVACSDGNLKYFKRQKLSWNEIFQTITKHHFISLKSQDNEIAIGITSDGGLYKLQLAPDGEKLFINNIHQYDPVYTNFVLIYPNGNFLIAVNSLNEIFTIKIDNGEKISQLLANISMNQIVLKANPIFPFVAIGNSNGNIYCVSLLDPKNPTLLTEFLLSRQAIQSMRFSNDGNYLIANDVEANQFIISCTPGTKMTVLHHFKEDFLATEFFVVESRNELSMILLTNSVPGVNDKILKFSLQLDDLDASIERSEWELVTIYNTIIPFKNSLYTFYAIRKNSTIIEILKLNENEIELVDVIKSPHLMKNVEGWNDKYHLITWSIDGTIAVYDTRENHKLLVHFVAANRHHFGIKRARCDPKCKFIISLDHSGNLVCSTPNLTKLPNEEIENEIAKYENLVTECFSKATSGGFPTLSQEFQGTKKFIDLKDERAYQMEAEESEETRILLFDKIERLRKNIKRLLNENEENEDEEKLEIQEFNLDLVTTAKKEDEAQQERNQQDKKMLNYIEAQSNLNQWLIDKCWSHLAVKGTKLRGMFLNYPVVENFPLLPDSNNYELERIQMIRTIENSVAREDNFIAWRPIPTSELERIFVKEPTMFELDTKDMTQFKKLTSSLMGSSSYKFLEISPLHYQQLDIVTFHQMKIEKILVESELTKLKKEFNKKFDTMHRTKEYQIHSIRFKNDRLRHIQNELKILDELKNIQVGSLVQILDPDFQFDEIPDTVIHVIESEVPVAPYISPSMQKVLQEQEAAREKRRRELEADDFRDRALDIMMDGVLEYKWEDEIKKTPKPPECLIKEKPGEDWTEIEERQVFEYEQECEKLKVEREKYRRMLIEEQKLLQNMLDEEIHKFNFNLVELSVEKLKFDMTIGHEEMKLLMLAVYNFKRIAYNNEEIKIRLKMEKVKKDIEKLNNLQAELQDWTRDLKSNYENLQSKDRILEKQFKANFNEQCPQAPADQAFKYFKRRPKLQMMKLSITAPILLEVAKKVASKKITQHNKLLLPSECIDFLNGVDSLDLVPTSTTGIDSTSWQVLCKMRRIKIESEFKIKSLGMQVADAEATHLAFMKETNANRQYLQALERQLVDLKEARENDLINRFVQLVLKRGLIEIHLSGSFHDFHDTILIHRSDVADINQIILKAGNKKLLALKNGSFFRRRITLKEWEHKVLKLKVKDLEEFVKTIEKCKITKEVQTWLKKKERGWSDDLSEDALKRQIENSINSQEKILSDLLKEISAYQNHIDLKRKEMKIYDKEIQLLNIDVSEKNIMRDVEFEKEQVKAAKSKMSTILSRAKIVRTIQNQHSHLLQLTTLLELQRLKTFPTLNAKQNERYQKTYR